MLFLLLGLALSYKHMMLAKLSSPEDYASLAQYAHSVNATLRPLDRFSKRGLYYRLVNYTDVNLENTVSTAGFVIESVPPYVQHLDPLYGNQGPYLRYINLPAAWTNYGKGNSSQVIAIVDSGRFLTSQELSNHWVNVLDNTTDTSDNDLNGYIDDTQGWNVVCDNNDLSEAGVYNSASDIYFSHGTSVWATAAAPENGYGIEGVSPHSRVVLVKAGVISGNQVYFFPDDLVSAMDYLFAIATIDNVDIRVQIASYGGGSYSSVLESAINDAIGNRTLFVASAGNYNSNVEVDPIYPCKFTLNHKLCVGAVNLDGTRASYSNFGSSVHLSAPGTVIVPLHPGSGGEVFGWASGTSFSAPLVGGAAALLASANASLTPGQIAFCLKETAFTTGHSLGTSTNGVLDVNAAITFCLTGEMPAHPPPSPPPHIGAAAGNIFTLSLALLIH